MLPNESKVPDTRGMGLRDALYLLENSGMRTEVIGYGSVWQQYPEPGGPLVPGSKVRLIMSSER